MRFRFDRGDQAIDVLRALYRRFAADRDRPAGPPAIVLWPSVPTMRISGGAEDRVPTLTSVRRIPATGSTPRSADAHRPGGRCSWSRLFPRAAQEFLKNYLTITGCRRQAQLDLKFSNVSDRICQTPAASSADAR
jgi:hypothetical protein